LKKDDLIKNALKRAEEVCKTYFKSCNTIKENDNKYIIQDNKQHDLITLNIAENGYFEYSLSSKFINGFTNTNSIKIEETQNILILKKFKPEISKAIIASINDFGEYIVPLNYQKEQQNHHHLVIDSLSVNTIFFRNVTIPVTDNKTGNYNLTALIFVTSNKEYALPVLPIIDKNIQGLLALELMRKMRHNVNIGDILKGFEGGLGDFDDDGIPSALF